LKQNYENEAERTALVDHKEKLKEIRDFYKPIDRIEMNQWKKDYSSRKRELSLKLK